MNIKENLWFVWFNIFLLLWFGLCCLASYGTHTSLILWCVAGYIEAGFLMSLSIFSGWLCKVKLSNIVKMVLLWYPSFYSERLRLWIDK